MPVKPIPEGYRSITPYLTVEGGAAAIDFYTRAFGAKELFRMPTPDGKVGHAELLIGDSKIMLADTCPQMGNKDPKGLGGTPVTIHLYVENSDAAFDRAVKAGAMVRFPVETKFYGDRGGAVADPFGHLWYISTHVEDVAPDELARRAKEMYEKMNAGDKK